MRFKNLTYLFCIFALLLLQTSNITAQVVLTEIMFDPVGNENADEFIEIYNAGTASVNLSGWKVADNEAEDYLMPLDQGLFLEAGQFGLILDPGYFDYESDTYDGMVPTSALVLTIDNSTFGSSGLSNSTAETVFLLNSSGIVVSQYTYSLNNEPGFSDEKIIPWEGDDSENWTNAQSLKGSPGAWNTVSPPMCDLALTDFWSEPEEPPVGTSFTLWAKVVNVGLEETPSVELHFYFDEDISGTFEESERFSVQTIPVLTPEDSAKVSVYIPVAEEGARIFQAELAIEDDDSLNNNRILEQNVSQDEHTLIINEIQYRPLAGRSEWIEFYHIGRYPLNITHWQFADATGLADSSKRYMFPSLQLLPGDFLVLAADSEIFHESIPDTIHVIVWGNNAPALNNSGDSLVLWNANGERIEQVNYAPNWGRDDEGLALERISPESASNEPLNWASSTDPSGGTPGRPNSQLYIPALSGENILTIEPNPFSPDGDGFEDIVFIHYNLNYPNSRLDLKIFDVRGRKVRWLANNESVGQTGEKLWDGRDDRGRALPIGIYVMYLEALAEGDTRIEKAKRAVVIARRR